MLHIFVNEILYLVYFFGLIGFLVFAEFRRRREMAQRPGEVTRASTSLAIIHGTFIVITIINLGIAQIVFPLLPTRISRFAFAMMLIETAIWAYLIYLNGWLRNKLIGLVGTAGRDR